MNSLTGEKVDAALRALVEIRGLSRERGEAIVHALIDVAESIEKIHSASIPKLLLASSSEEVQEILWEIREEFRHVEYHIQDSGLGDL